MKPERHRWFKPRIHVYVCMKCGTGKVNAETAAGYVTTYHRPDGTSVQSTTVPPCAPGPLTEKYVGKYAIQIAESMAAAAAAKQSTQEVSG